MKTLALGQSSQQITNSRRIGFLVYPGCEILDVCGPHDVFSYADTWLTRFGRSETGYQCILIAAAPGLIRTKCGIEIAPTHTFREVGDKLDTLVVAGGCMNVEEAREDPTLVEWVRSMAPGTRRVASICTGAFILAEAGLLNHRRVTTHWMFSELLATTFPLVHVDSSPLFCRDGNIYSSGGITAGIDLALALLEEDLGPALTLTVARRSTQWRPPATSSRPRSSQPLAGDRVYVFFESDKDLCTAPSPLSPDSYEALVEKARGDGV